MRVVGIDRGIEITSMADIVGGTGLGSSSSFTVGALHVLHAYKGEYVSAERLSREACEVEIDRLREPIGKQGQYIAAYGGFQFIEFMRDEGVRVSPIICPAGTLERLHANLLLFYTGRPRSASPILRRAATGFGKNKDLLKRMREQADAARDALQAGRAGEIGRLLHEGWLLKKRLGSGITNLRIDGAYNAARSAGAVGGKIAGAGGGGFLMLFVPPLRQGRVRRALRAWREIEFSFEPQGSRIIYVSR